MNICRDCKHFTDDRTFLQAAGGQTNRPRCQHPDASTRDPVMGTCWCEEERQSKKGCGPTGKLWEKRA